MVQIHQGHEGCWVVHSATRRFRATSEAGKASSNWCQAAHLKDWSRRPA